MAIGVQTLVRLYFIPDGAGAMEVPSGQTLSLTTPVQIAGGGNSPTFATISAALDAVDTLLQAQITALLPQITAWGSGGN